MWSFTKYVQKEVKNWLLLFDFSRTARGDNQGNALSFVSVKDMELLGEVERALSETGGKDNLYGGHSSALICGGDAVHSRLIGRNCAHSARQWNPFISILFESSLWNISTAFLYIHVKQRHIPSLIEIVWEFNESYKDVKFYLIAYYLKIGVVLF